NSIGGSLNLQNNIALTNLTGLTNITSIGGDLIITSCESLNTLNGLDELISVGGELIIIGNDSLTSLSGIDNINPGSITDLSIEYNPSLSTCNIEAICNYLVDPNGEVYISNNDEGCQSQYQIISICENYFPCLYGGVVFTTQQEIDDFPINYPNCNVIGGDLTVAGSNTIFNLNGLSNLIHIEGSLSVSMEDWLWSLEGLDNIQTIGGDLTIYGLQGMTDILPLSNLTSVGGSIEIIYLGISSLEGLKNIDPASITDLTITNNFSLTECDIQNICDYLIDPNGTIEIHDNAPGCNSETEIYNACWVKVDETSAIENSIRIFPNPAKNTITILNSSNTKIEEINIFSPSGKTILQKKDPANSIDILKLRAGLYFVEVKTGMGNVRRKLIVE
ncbi:MAG: T9SS type A sorting domain-containing protein, partial [Chlorobi bacterium]|nr:T9SS type A sorting domain-containing protein [Chlorobiota bacterium]